MLEAPEREACATAAARGASSGTHPMTRSVSSFVSLCTLSSLGEERPALVRGPGGRRLVCIRRGDAVDVLDDECPHEGHPLSMGLARECVLTCPWHNWRFDTRSGACLVGEESVRRHRSEVLHGEVFVAIDQDEHELERHERDLLRALEDGSIDGAARSALRVARAAGPVRPWIVALSRAALHEPSGSIALFTTARAAWTLYDDAVLSLAEALTVLSVAAIDVMRSRRELQIHSPIETSVEQIEDVLGALVEGRSDEVVSRALGLLDGNAASEACARWLAPWLATRLWNSGQLLVAVDDARALIALCEREGEPHAARVLLAGVLRAAAFAVAESDLPGWRSTRQALLDVRARSLRSSESIDAESAAALAQELLGGEAQCIAAIEAQLDRGARIPELHRALARAAVERVARYDVRWSSRATVHPITALDVGAAVSLARTVIDSAIDGRLGASHALMTAGLIGKHRRTSLDSPPETQDGDDSLDALRALVRRGCLSSGVMRGEGATLAAALWTLAKGSIVETSRCVSAARRAFVDDAPQDLARVAQVARLRVGRDGTVKTAPSSVR